MGSKFVNTAKRIEKSNDKYVRKSEYLIDHMAEYLIFYGRYFQALVSQTGTYLLTGKFHDQEVGIYKCEGGCKIAGRGALVLGTHACYYDHGYKESPEEEKLSALITDLVLAFDPENPFDSLKNKAIEHVKCNPEELETALSKSGGHIFSGDALSDFFNRNPFDTSRRVTEEYERWARINVYKQPEAEVDLVLEYDKKSHKFLKELQDKIIKCNPGTYTVPMCCSPRKIGDGSYSFWINTGRDTNIDGWKTEEQIEKFLKSDGKIFDTARR